MYIRTSEALRPVPTSYLCEFSINGVAEIVAKPVLLTHYHVRKHLHPGAGLLSDTAPSVMTPASMKPGLVNDQRRVRLQQKLETLVRTKYRAAVSPRTNLRIALVDLTEAKHHTPIFAGFRAWNVNNPGELATVEGDSLVKILALYALYQLRFDLNYFARDRKITKGDALRAAIVKEWTKTGLTKAPALRKLFQFVEKSGEAVQAKLRGTPNIHENFSARDLILALGFEYIGSVTLQSGLFDEKHGGLWLRAAYGSPAITWSRSPFRSVPRHSATAFSVATFFTLLAQGRLADQASSNEIANVLKTVQCMSNGLLDGVKRLPGVPAASSNKCGLLRPRFADAIHVIRQPIAGKRLEYVAAVLSKEPPTVDFTELGKDLDSIIVSENSGIGMLRRSM